MAGRPGVPPDVLADEQARDRDMSHARNAIALAESRRLRAGLPPKHPFNREQAMEFVTLVASSTMTLNHIAEHVGVPAPIFLMWASRYDEIGEAYTRARDAQQHLRADEIIEIADDGKNDWMEIETKAGRVLQVYNHEHAKRSELRIKARQWLMSRFAPRVFGERLQIEAGQETLQAIAAKSDDERLQDAMSLIERAKRRVAEAYEAGEVSDAEYEEHSQLGESGEKTSG
jgi:hypothetical protein